MKKVKLLLCLSSLFSLSLNANAQCSTLQGVTLCDNGDSQLQISNQIYTLKGDKLTKQQVKECHAGALYNGRVYSIHCNDDKAYSLIYGLTPEALSVYGIYIGDQ